MMSLIGWECKHSNVFSGPVLIGRGLEYRFMIYSLIIVIVILGQYNIGGTPVLIPNTEVKSYRVYGTAGLPWWESRFGQE